MSRKPLFDRVRQMLGRGMQPHEVSALDGKIDNLLQDTVTCVTFDGPAPAPAAIGPATISPDGIALIKQFEGCAKKRRDGRIEDPATGADPWTIGWGATGHGIAKGTIWTKEACDARLEADLERYAEGVSRALDGAATTQAQFDALVSFHYNTGAIAKATLTRKHKAGDFAGAAREFDRWCYAGGRVMKGLARRRAAEAALYRKG